MNNKTTEEIVDALWEAFGAGQLQGIEVMTQGNFTAAITPYIELAKAAERIWEYVDERDLPFPEVMAFKSALNNIPKS